jgi:hypothetical protein
MFSWIIRRIGWLRPRRAPLPRHRHDTASAYERARQEAISMMLWSSYTGPK